MEYNHEGKTLAEAFGISAELEKEMRFDATSVAMKTVEQARSRRDNFFKKSELLENLEELSVHKDLDTVMSMILAILAHEKVIQLLQTGMLG